MQKELVFSGSPFEIGSQHGEALRDEIRAVFDIYLDIWGIPKERISQRVEGFKDAIAKYFPNFVEEIKGIAAGAAFNEDFVYAINARTELLTNHYMECTAIGVKSQAQQEGHVVLGQNWDWLNDLRGLTRIVQINPLEKPRMKIMIEPGMIGKIGMNEAGVGVCTNFLNTPKVLREGVPVRVLLRGILECDSYNKASSLVHSLPRAASANYLICDINNNVGSLESTPLSVRTVSYNIVTHTNVFSARGQYCQRQERFEKALRARMTNEKLSLNSIVDSLKDVEAEPLSIRGIETVHTVIMDLTAQQMMVSDGARCNRFTSYKF